MNNTESIGLVRKDLDKIDEQILQLFEQRMESVDQIAEIKRAGNIAINDEDREQAIVNWAVSRGKEEYQGETITFVRTLLGLSKFRQRKLLFDNKENLLLPPPRPKTQGPITVAYQGTEGAWGEQASIQLFKDEEKISYTTFEDVFEAVKSKKVNYGVLPIENSKTGAIGEVYDLLRKNGCYIVDQTWVQSRHCLMVVPGTKLSEIREVCSHSQGLQQCNNFLKNKSWDLTPYRNTAVAAQTVSERGDKRLAAIGSPRAAKLYNLEIIASDIMDDHGNKTRFIAIADEPEYNEASNTVSITFLTGNRSGALCEVLFHFLSAGINLTRIESRPMVGETFCFFADLNGNIQDENMARGLRHATASCGYLEVLGCFHSV